MCDMWSGEDWLRLQNTLGRLTELDVARKHIKQMNPNAAV